MLNQPLFQFAFLNNFNICPSHPLIWALNNSIVEIVEQVILIIWCFSPWFFKKASNLPLFFFINRYMFRFIYNLVADKINMKKKNFLIWFVLLFCSILLANLFGMLPYAYTTSSYIALTFFYSIQTFISLNIIGYRCNGAHMLKLFFPAGVPYLISFFLLWIEIVSYTSRVFSISIRLFANMMAGHTLMKILISFFWSAFWAGSFYILLSSLPLIIVFFIFFLECTIALLQTYVYTVLFAIYINEAINLH